MADFISQVGGTMVGTTVQLRAVEASARVEPDLPMQAIIQVSDTGVDRLVFNKGWTKL